MNNTKYTVKYFEVKNGKNKGHYFGVNNINHNQMVNFMRDNDINLGIIQKEYNIDFYRKHSLQNGLIIGFSSDTTHEYNKKIAYKYINTLNKNGYTIDSNVGV